MLSHLQSCLGAQQTISHLPKQSKPGLTANKLHTKKVKHSLQNLIIVKYSCQDKDVKLLY